MKQPALGNQGLTEKGHQPLGTNNNSCKTILKGGLSAPGKRSKRGHFVEHIGQIEACWQRFAAAMGARLFQSFALLKLSRNVKTRCE